VFTADEQAQFFESVLFTATGQVPQVRFMEFLSGGCINVAVKLETTAGNFFLKFNERADAGAMFAAEAQGLALLREAGNLRTPEVLAQGQLAGRAYLLLEYLPPGLRTSTFWADLGRGLAGLHRHENSNFGLHFDNFIGELAQNNSPTPDGIGFFVERRLKAQAGLAFYNGLIGKELLRQLDRLCAQLPSLLPAGRPSLLHGDLWSGNVLANGTGQPCLIDPAVYYGLREAEIAFTQLFGGFEPEFYAAYQEAYPLEPGFAERAALYNLYPLLVHANLFGPAYLSGVERTLDRYV
jgi:protein-ribulosamine 3-kinase